MSTFALSRYLLSNAVAAALLAGCSGALPVDSAQGTPAQDGAQPPLGAVAHHTTSTWSFRVVHDFFLDGSKGEAGASGGLLDVGGALYGTTSTGGGGSCSSGCGTVYRLTTSGSDTHVYNFAGDYRDGQRPLAGLFDVNGTLYGTTQEGGTGGEGTVYSVTTAGAEKVLHNFSYTLGGENPAWGVVKVDGTLYGVAGGGKYGYGVVYGVSASGTAKVLHRFTSRPASHHYDGQDPSSGLIDIGGTLYGTTSSGGVYGNGAVYSVTRSGKEKLLYSFQGKPDGSIPSGDLLNLGGTLYGVTWGGGAHRDGAVYSVTTTGTERVLYSFADAPDGAQPNGGLTDVDGTLYGTTATGGTAGCGGSSGCGTIFSLSTSGSEQVLYSFTGGAHGYHPNSPLVSIKGTLYGSTEYGGETVGCRRVGCGIIFALSP